MTTVQCMKLKLFCVSLNTFLWIILNTEWIDLISGMNYGKGRAN